MQKNLRLFCGLMLAFLAVPLSAQNFFYSTQTLFPTTSGNALRDSLVIRYKPISVLSYSEARDTLAGIIYRQNDSVECIYSGYKLHLPLGVDPADHIFQSGGANGINTEHGYPQSMGASTGNARSDMHHLFPARAGTNSGRSNFPYANIPDNQVDTWFILNQATTTDPPLADRPKYSRLRTNTSFEPRAVSKGNVARAVFYFYTMYKAEADFADANFFANQRDTLCTWHMQDPVDSAEWHRTWQIARYQVNRPNPFVIDCSLVKRMYCNTIITDPCLALSVDRAWQAQVGALLAYPNPATHQLNIELHLLKSAKVRIDIIDLTGRSLYTICDEERGEGEQIWQWTIPADLHNGLYFYRATLDNQAQASQKFMLQR